MTLNLKRLTRPKPDRSWTSCVQTTLGIAFLYLGIVLELVYYYDLVTRLLRYKVLVHYDLTPHNPSDGPKYIRIFRNDISTLSVRRKETKNRVRYCRFFFSYISGKFKFHERNSPTVYY